jgi:hypothetical protein
MHHVVIAMSMDRGLGRVHGNAKRLSFRKGKYISELEIQRKKYHTYRNGHREDGRQSHEMCVGREAS